MSEWWEAPFIVLGLVASLFIVIGMGFGLASLIRDEFFDKEK